MKSRRIIYALKIPRHRAKFEDPQFILFPIIAQYRFDNAVIEQPRGRTRGTRNRLDRKSLSCLCISQRDTLWIYGFRQLSTYLLFSEGSMPTTTRIHYGTLEFSAGRTIMTSLYTRRLITVKVYIHTSAHTHVILLRTSGCTSSHTFHLSPSSVYDKCGNTAMISNWAYRLIN